MHRLNSEDNKSRERIKVWTSEGIKLSRFLQKILSDLIAEKISALILITAHSSHYILLSVLSQNQRLIAQLFMMQIFTRSLRKIKLMWSSRALN